MNFFGSKQGGSLVQSAVRPLAASMAATLSVALLSACIGGGGGDSSSDEMDLLRAYEKIHECMSNDDLVRVVGSRPNEHESGNTMIWESKDYRMMIELHRWSSGNYYVTSKYILGPGVDRYEGVGSEDCEG